MTDDRKKREYNRVGIRVESRQTQRINAVCFGGFTPDGVIRWKPCTTVVAPQLPRSY